MPEAACWKGPSWGEGQLAPCFTPQPRPASACLWPTVNTQRLRAGYHCVPHSECGAARQPEPPARPWAFEKHMLKVNDLDPLVPRRGSGAGLQVTPLRAQSWKICRSHRSRAGLHSPARRQLRGPCFQGKREGLRQPGRRGGSAPPSVGSRDALWTLSLTTLGQRPLWGEAGAAGPLQEPGAPGRPCPSRLD